LDVASAERCRGEPFAGREATAPSFIREIKKVQGWEQAPKNGALALPKDVVVEPLGGEMQSILYGRRWWIPSSLGRGESSVSKYLWLVPTPEGVPECELTLLWLVLDADSSLII
jgi:hypothetical protein